MLLATVQANSHPPRNIKLSFDPSKCDVVLGTHLPPENQVVIGKQLENQKPYLLTGVCAYLFCELK